MLVIFSSTVTLERFNGLKRVLIPEGMTYFDSYDICYIRTQELNLIKQIEIDNENIWDDAPIILEIYQGKDGFGIYYEYPEGYSEYTYEPDTIKRYYQNCDWDWFFNFGLDQEQREMLNGFKP